VSSDFLPRIRGKGLPYHPITLHLSFDFSAFLLVFNVCLLACSVWCLCVCLFRSFCYFLAGKFMLTLSKGTGFKLCSKIPSPSVIFLK